MTLRRVTPAPVPEFPRQAAGTKNHKKRSRLRIALTEGDIIVLTTAPIDSNGFRQEVIEPVNFYQINSMQHVPDVRWSVVDKFGHIYDGRVKPVTCHPFLTLSIPIPISIIRTARGFKTVMVASVAAGYRIHHLDFVRRNLPGVYQQLEFA